MKQRLPLDEAIRALRRDPTHPVLVKVDEGLTVEVRAVEAAGQPKKTMGDLLREVGRWEGESGAELDALFSRQRGNRQAPDLTSDLKDFTEHKHFTADGHAGTYKAANASDKIDYVLPSPALFESSRAAESFVAECGPTRTVTVRSLQ